MRRFANAPVRWLISAVRHFFEAVFTISGVEFPAAAPHAHELIRRARAADCASRDALHPQDHSEKNNQYHEISVIRETIARTFAWRPLSQQGQLQWRTAERNRAGRSTEDILAARSGLLQWRRKFAKASAGQTAHQRLFTATGSRQPSAATA